MLRSLKDLDLYRVSASDGELGSIENFLFEDELWGLRYLVVAAGGILGGRRVLIPLAAFRHADWATRRFHLALTLDKIKNGPGVDTDKPVSRQHDREYVRYYGFTDPPSPRPEMVRTMLICGASRRSAATRFKGATPRSGTFRISWSTTRRGQFDISWSTSGTGGWART